MQKKQILKLIEKNRTEITDYFKGFADNKRNRVIDMHRDYYDGYQWLINGEDRSNTTRSGRVIWGNRNDMQYAPDDALRRRPLNRGNSVSFKVGQLQTRNLIKPFVQVYQDYTVGTANEEVQITSETEGQEINEEATEIEIEQTQDLDDYFESKEGFLKGAIARGVTDTVMLSKIVEENGEKKIVLEDARNYIPIYNQDTKCGSIYICEISKEQAMEYGVEADGDNIQMIDIFLEDEGLTYFVKFVDGNMLGDAMVVVDYDPYTFVPNIDHAYRNFDINDLEDSEMFNWIPRQDRLNADETIEFVVNQFLAMPKVSLDFKIMKEMNIDIKNQGLQDALANFQFFPGSIDSLPIIVQEGKGIPDSFYKGKDETVRSMYEDAGIPRFISTGEGMSNVASETIALGLKMLERKIDQKRDQLTELIEENFKKILPGADIDIEFPDLTGLTPNERMLNLKELASLGLLPQEYITEKALDILGWADDLERVTELQQADMMKTRQDAMKRATEVRSQLEAQAQIQKKEQTQRELESVQEQIQSIS